MSFILALKVAPLQRATSTAWNTLVYTVAQLYTTGPPIIYKYFQNGNLYIPNIISANVVEATQKILVQGEPVLTELDPIYIAGFVGFANTQLNQVIQGQNRIYQAIANLPSHIQQSTQYIVNQIYSDNYKTYRLLQKITNEIYIFDTTLLQKIRQNELYLSSELYKWSVGITNAIKKSVLKELYIANYILGQIYKMTSNLTQSINTLIMYLSPPSVTSLSIKLGRKLVPISSLVIKTVDIILQSSPSNTYVIYIGGYVGTTPYVNFPLFPGDRVEISVNNLQNIWAYAEGPAILFALANVL